MNIHQPDIALHPRYKKMNESYLRASVARNVEWKSKANHEEFYLNDVEGTKSQLTKLQKEEVISEYDIPLSTKVCFPIIEQFLAIITSNKPYPRLISTTDSTQEFTQAYEKAYRAVWYESKSDREVRTAARDSLVTGSGFLRVRKASFLTENTFNVVHEHVSWREVFIDPDTRKEDLEDCRWLTIAKVLPAGRVEKDYDITLTEEDYYTPENTGYFIDDSLLHVLPVQLSEVASDKDFKYCFVREHYTVEKVNIYFSNDGVVSTKKPKPIEIPNPEREALLQQIQEVAQQLQSANTQAQQAESGMQNLTNDPLLTNDPAQWEANSNGVGDMAQQSLDNNQQFAQLAEQLTNMKEAYDDMPKTIPAFSMIPEGQFNSVVVMEYQRKTEKRVRYDLWCGKSLVDSELIPHLTRVPVVHFAYITHRMVYKTYGIIHFIKDIVKAMNKYYAMHIKELQMHGLRKVMYFEGTISDPARLEKDWSKPGATIKVIPNTQLQNSGMPTIVEGGQSNQAFIQLIDRFLALIEYITGVNSQVQGNPQDTPNTFGATQSNATFGQQRIKLFARSMEKSLEDLALITVQFMQAYSPKDKIIHYFGEDSQPEQVQLYESSDDLQFKVRVDLGNSLATSKQMMVQLLSQISGQTQNPAVADALTQYALKLMDMPEMNKLAGDIDAIKEMQNQLQQLQSQVKQLTMTNDAQQKQIVKLKTDLEVQEAVSNATGDLAVEKQKKLSEIEQNDGSLTNNSSLNEIPF